jgi:hypothetical protein
MTRWRPFTGVRVRASYTVPNMIALSFTASFVGPQSVRYIVLNDGVASITCCTPGAHIEITREAETNRWKSRSGAEKTRPMRADWDAVEREDSRAGRW